MNDSLQNWQEIGVWTVQHINYKRVPFTVLLIIFTPPSYEKYRIANCLRSKTGVQTRIRAPRLCYVAIATFVNFVYTTKIIW
jgi:hypothetical protein